MGKLDFLLVVLCLHSVLFLRVGSVGQMMESVEHDKVYIANSKSTGYQFSAPVNFTITGLRITSEVEITKMSNEPASFEIIRLLDGDWGTGNLESLRWLPLEASTLPDPIVIEALPIVEGWKIGIIGHRNCKCNDLGVLPAMRNISGIPTRLEMLTGTTCLDTTSVATNPSFVTNTRGGRVEMYFCKENCISCVEWDYCNECASGWYLYLGDCLSNCGVLGDECINNDTTTPPQCTGICDCGRWPHCQSCFPNGTCQNCESDPVQYYRLYEQVGSFQCVSDCEAEGPFYSDMPSCVPCDDSECLQCLGGSSCSLCNSSLYVLEGESCVSNCTLHGFIPDNSTMNCVNSSCQVENCATCSNLTTCAQCYSFHFLKKTSGTTCVVDCGAGMWGNSLALPVPVCEFCSPNCTFCSDGETCIQCVDRYKVNVTTGGCDLVIWECGEYLNNETEVCSNNGTCISPQLCHCPNYEQPWCQNWRCGSYLNNDTNVCSGNGTCTSPEECICPNYVQPNCQNWNCGNYLNNDTDFVCSGNGTCNSPEECICSEYEQPFCQNWKCGLFLNNETEVCSGNGTCNSPGECICTDYFGAECQFWKCFGFFANDTDNVCSGNGTCVSPDVCYCPSYVGYECQNWKCGEFWNNDTAVCSNNGTCNSPELCLCEDYIGKYCGNWECYGILSNVSNVCSNNGTCNSPEECICPDYVGEYCGNWKCGVFWNNDTDACSTNGTCNSPDVCICDDYVGKYCDNWECGGYLANETEVCMSNGTCNSPDVCVCPDYVGSYCSHWKCGSYWNNDTDVCSSNGTCNSPGECLCPDYFGDDCQFWKCFGYFANDTNNVCSANGTCIAPDVCRCLDYVGNECQNWKCGDLWNNDTSVCSTNGTCNSPDVCNCGSYKGKYCDNWECNGILANETDVCSSNGTCDSPEVCICPDYELPYCEYWKCGEFLNNETDVCSTNGTCNSPDECICGDYVGRYCDNWECDVYLANETDVCSNNGTCDSPEMCICPDYVGSYCSHWKCGEFWNNDTEVCSNNGTCNSPGECVCPDYEFSYCQNWKCGEHLNNETAVCSNNGTCDSPGECVCPDYLGAECEFWKCFGIFANDTDNVCSGNGSCIAPNVCDCLDYVGYECQNWKCGEFWNNDTDVCSTNGTCNSPDVCICGDYVGKYCGNWECGGILANETSVCSTNGTCDSPEVCICPYHELPYCANWKCGEFLNNETDNVCSANGTCNSPDVCICGDYVGKYCDNWECGVYLANETDVCSTNGTCNSPEICVCPDYVGSYCSHWKCGSFWNNDTEVCSNNGSCNSPGECLCPDYLGNECQFWKCFGFFANDTDYVCSGNGTCVAPDICHCLDFVGYECQNWKCGGLWNNDTTVCSTNGTCNSPDTCLCGSYNGKYCDNWECNGIMANETDVCSSNGTCNSPEVCICLDYELPFCQNWKCGESLNNETAVCSSNGTCNSPGECICPDYLGDECQFWKCFGYFANDTDNVCSGNGSCIAPDVCHCPTYVGYDCQNWKCGEFWKNDTDVCSTNGTCNSPGVCLCGAYQGKFCGNWECGGYLANETEVCSSNGTCDSPEVCICPDYELPYCENWKCGGYLNNETDVCSTNGTCNSPDLCICGEYVGKFCDNWECDGILANITDVCSGNGSCVAPRICDCFDDRYGPLCNVTDLPVCSGKTDLDACSYPNGTCFDDETCICPNYYGSECEIWKCGSFHSNETTACSGNGSCSSPNFCFCPDYTGIECENWKCFGYFQNDTTNVCSGNGTCLAPNFCHCPEYSGKQCQVWECGSYFFNDTDNVCSGNGSCVSPGTCFCPEYEGSICDDWKCFDFLRGDAQNVCSGKGTCFAPDQCLCGEYFGRTCDNWKCWGVPANDSLVCSNKGSCVSPNECQCSDSDSWLPPFCNTTTCDTILSTNEAVCSSNGKCVSFEVCECGVGSIGDYCEVPFDPPTVHVTFEPAVGRCTAISLDARESEGYDLEFYWSSNVPFYSFSTHSPVQDVETDEIGEFEFSVFAKDKWDRESEPFVFSVEKLNTSIPTAVVEVHSITTNVNPEEVFQISGFGDAGTCNVGLYDYEWKQLSGSDQIDFSGVDLNSKVIRFENGFPFVETTHFMEFTVSSPLGSSRSIVEITTNIRDLIAVISDSTKDIPVRSINSINGRGSFDPENRESVVETFDWNCKKLLDDVSCENFTIIGDNDVLFVPHFVGEYQITLTFLKDFRNDTTSIVYNTFEVSSPETYVPSIRVEYVPSKPSKYLIASERVVLRGTIEVHEQVPYVTFMWECDTLPNLRDIILSQDLTSLDLVISPNSIKENTICKLHAYHEDIHVTASISLIFNSPPRYGTIRVTPSINFVFQDFWIAISNWQDEDVPIESSIEYKHVITNRTKYVHPYTQQSVYSFQISSQGCASTNYSVDLIIRLRDSYGSETIEFVPVIVKPSESDLIESLIRETVEFLNYRMEGNDYRGEGLSKILVIINFVTKTICSSMSWQELLCMTVEDCESTDIPKLFPELFETFQLTTIKYLETFLNEFDNSHLDSLVSIIDNFLLTSEELVRELYSFVKEFLEKFITEIEFGQFRVFLDIFDKYVQILKDDFPRRKKFDVGNDVYNTLHFFFHYFVKRLTVGEKNLYLESTENIIFDFENDYSPNYRENLKLRIDLKVMSIENEFDVVIPGEVVYGLGLSTVASSVLVRVPKLDVENSTSFILSFFTESGFIDNVLVSPLVIKIRNIHFQEDDSIECSQLSMTGSELQSCEKLIESGDQGIEGSCLCDRSSGYFSYSQGGKETTSVAPPTGGILIAAIVGTVIGLVVLMVLAAMAIIITIFVVIALKRKKRKIFPNSDSQKTESDTHEKKALLHETPEPEPEHSQDHELSEFNPEDRGDSRFLENSTEEVIFRKEEGISVNFWEEKEKGGVWKEEKERLHKKEISLGKEDFRKKRQKFGKTPKRQSMSLKKNRSKWEKNLRLAKSEDQLKVGESTYAKELKEIEKASSELNLEFETPQ